MDWVKAVLLQDRNRNVQRLATILLGEGEVGKEQDDLLKVRSNTL
jgi:hypothetical protein